MKKLLFIVNPVAGMMKSKPYMLTILRTFCESDYVPTVLTTRSKGDATAFVTEHAAEFDRVVCCGGDGTLSETIAGVIASGASLPIGYLAAGSTNDLARTLGIPLNIPKAAINAVHGVPTGLDIGLVNGRKSFSYVASFGLFTRTSYETPQELKNVFGHLAYLWEGAKELTNIPSYEMTVITPNGTVSDSYIFGAVTNSLSIGGVFKFKPSRVSLNDGLFEIMLIRRPRDLIELGSIVSHMKDGTFEDPNIVFMQAESLAIRSKETVAWTFDGEFGGDYTDMKIENQRRRIEIILPQE